MTTVNGSRDLMERFGFVFDEGGVHLARTMMLDDLTSTLQIRSTSPSLEQFAAAIKNENVLGKRSAQSRALALRHLSRLYGLDNSIALFRAFNFLWAREEEGRPLLCLLIAYARDAILRASAPFVLDLRPEDRFEREKLEAFIEDLRPGRFSEATLGSTARNLASTWTQSGHLVGRAKKLRRRVQLTPASVAFALLLGYIAGERGRLLFECEYVKLLDGSAIKAMELAEMTARKGWIDFKRIGSIVEVAFPRLLTAAEMELIREQD